MSSKNSDPSNTGNKYSNSIIKRPRYRIWRMLVGILAGLFLFILAGGGLFAWIKYEGAVQDLPTVEGLKNYAPPVMSRIYSNNDRVMAELASERRLFVPITLIPDRVKNAFISTEDKNFYSHGGIDPLAIVRAVVQDMFRKTSGKRLVGASTITQQVARNMLLNNKRNLNRKIKEAILAIRIEQSLTKDQILEIYLNEIYLGDGAYGVAAAAQTYFHKNLDQLTVAEAAYLGGLPKSPYNYDLYHHPKAGLERRNFVLSRMLETGAISKEILKQAMDEPLQVTQSVIRRGPLAGTQWFSEAVRRDLIDRYGMDKTMQGGLEVHTSLDLKNQNLATRLMQQALMKYDRQHGWRGAINHLNIEDGKEWSDLLARQKNPAGILDAWRVAIVLNSSTGKVGWLENKNEKLALLENKDVSWTRRSSHPLKMGDVVLIEPLADNGKVALRQVPLIEGALISVDVQTGRVLSMFGGWSFAESQFNRATQAQRQPGSSFKPIAYLAGMEQNIPPSQIFMDSPFSAGSWHPNNYEKTFWGPTALHNGLRYSRNLVTIRLAAQVGMNAISNLAIVLGEVDSMPKVLPAVLGAVETTVFRHAGAYASIAAEGLLTKPTLIDYIQDRNGKVIWHSDVLQLEHSEDPGRLPLIIDHRKRVASAQSSYQIITMMEDVMKRGTGMSAARGIDRPLAGKTGTSQDFNDAWFAGFSPDVVTVVWFGFDQPKTLGKGMSGAVVAAPVWNEFMKNILANRPKLDFAKPEGVFLASYDTSKGSVTDAFKEGQTPGISINLNKGAATGELTAQDTGAENIPDSEESMDSNEGIVSPFNEGSEKKIGEKTGQSSSSGEGEDIGMGGLY